MTENSVAFDAAGSLKQAKVKPSNTVGKRDARIFQIWRLVSALTSDGVRFWKYSFTKWTNDREHYRAEMAMDLHFIEYGMSLRNPRYGYGKNKIARLLDDLEHYVANWGADEQTEIAAKTLQAYVAFNRHGGLDMDALEARVRPILALQDTGMLSGAEFVTRDEIQSVGKMDFLAFARARHSIRQYSPEPVDPEAIRRAVAVAQQSPSSCNRQTCRVHVYTDKASVQKVLELQSGNRGFGDQLGGVCIVWTDERNWTEAAERAFGLVDGGMFLMSLAYGFHAEGLGAITLNWAEEPAHDKVLRRLTGLPDSAKIVSLLGFGSLPEDLRVPISHRRPIDTCMTLNAPLSN